MIDSERQWFKSSIGLDVQETPREDSFCAHTILTPDLLMAQDTRQDERFAENPYVLDKPHIRFYAGVPLTLPEGAAIGSLCVMDTVPKELTPEQQAALRNLVFWKDGNSLYLGCNAPFAKVAGLAAPAEVIGKSDEDLDWAPEESVIYREADRRVLESGQALMDMEERSRHADGTVTVSLTSKMPLHDAQVRVIGVLGVSQDVTERKAMEAETERLLAEAHARADRDPLTNLLNHRAFHTRLAEEAARAEREGTVLAVVVLDLDNFKFFNDVYGHVVGDDVLRLVAARL